ncbi:MAG: hypothetical protein R3B72_35985 [Polyangiaceae bacterium]
MVDLRKARAAGFHDQTVRSWDAGLPRRARLLVPVVVDALVVRQEGGTWADCRMRTPEEGGSDRAFDLLPDAFTDREPRPRGVHLHWAMPDGLTRIAGGGEEPLPQALPDRWLVLRIGPPRQRRVFSPSVSERAVPTKGSERRHVRGWVLDGRSGEATPLDDWVTRAPTGPPVTPLGGGDAGWAAYYDNVVNRFAFHDGLSDVGEGVVSYLVCGWYADVGDDPLASGTGTLPAFEARLAALGWALDGEELEAAREAAEARIQRTSKATLVTPHKSKVPVGERVIARKQNMLEELKKPVDGLYRRPDPYWPQQTIFHGSVVGVGWPREQPGSPEVGHPTASSVKVALGTTPADALGALIATSSDGDDEAEWLTAFSLGALQELDHPDGDTRIDDQLHAAAFVSISDGNETVPRKPSALGERSRRDVIRDKRKGARPARSKAPLGKALRSKWSSKAAGFRDIHKGRDRPFGAPESKTVTLPRPRLYVPGDPVIAVRGPARSAKHGGDGRFSEDGRLVCRLTGSAVRSLSLKVEASGARRIVRGSDVLDRPVAHGGVPDECEELLNELALLDIGSARTIALAARRQVTASSALDTGLVERNVEVEQTAWWAIRSPATDVKGLLAHSGLEGKLPSPLAVRPNVNPWVPLHLDWEVELVATPPRDWTPGEVDFAPPALPEGAGERFRGRSLLSAGVAESLAHTLRTYLENEAAAGGTALEDADLDDELLDLVTRLESLDVLSGTLERFRGLLRRDADDDEVPAQPPPGFFAMRAGFLRLRKVRLVDAFGQVLYLASSSASADADPSRVVVGGGARSSETGTMMLPPRFTAPSKIEFRFRDPRQNGKDATEDRSPVLGWLLPDHLDGALEVFDAAGEAIGQLLVHPEHGTIWEPAPGRLAEVGEAPGSAIPSAELAGLATSLFDAGPRDRRQERPPALGELLRVVDSTRWAVDPFAHTGEEHLALLVGHPIAVMAASVMVEVREPVGGSDVPITRVPVRLGSLTHWQDGLFGFFADGDFSRFHASLAAVHLARPSPIDGFLGPIDDVPGYAESFADDVSDEGPAATPADHPYVDASGILWITPGVRHDLVLLVEPHCVVHATTGLLPRKRLGVQRAWMTPALSTMAPTFRFGPVLRDPKQIRMPIAAEIGGAWTWTHRADVDRWAEEEVVHAGQEALLPPDPCTLTEGWLRLSPKPEGDG